MGARSPCSRVGSEAIVIGAGGPKVRELPLLVRVDLNIQWERPKLDLAELARKRWIEKWSVSRMAGYFGRSPETIQMHICKLRKGEGSLNFLKTKERKYVQHQMKKVFKGV